ncbi:MAG: molybdenum cofactor guanylyltransferase [Phycisphaerales bacterium]
MTTEGVAVSPGFLESIQPIVLVGGRSRRFGRDKLREPWGDGGRVLVQYPIDTLRAVFGHRVLLMGECDAAILPLADGVLTDTHPGIGPIGGILSGLKQRSGPICVLAGDMPLFRDVELVELLSTARMHYDALAILASTDRLHPCAGVYTQHARPYLEAGVTRGDHRLHGALDQNGIITVPVNPEATANVNTLDDLHRRDAPQHTL